MLHAKKTFNFAAEVSKDFPVCFTSFILVKRAMDSKKSSSRYLLKYLIGSGMFSGNGSARTVGVCFTAILGTKALCFHFRFFPFGRKWTNGSSSLEEETAPPSSSASASSSSPHVVCCSTSSVFLIVSSSFSLSPPGRRSTSRSDSSKFQLSAISWSSFSERANEMGVG